ncbi:unnamed protein product [Miscanthus lutarioriparius]|uniref:Uncharacterized protein n=1 Tax=Miscanthus lutarioriparius TaxID=422564 RepID=A0A811MEQ7_9POAL|nr:unnamed protein product [Miscanthus lutarioriparius]
MTTSYWWHWVGGGQVTPWLRRQEVEWVWQGMGRGRGRRWGVARWEKGAQRARVELADAILKKEAEQECGVGEG